MVWHSFASKNSCARSCPNLTMVLTWNSRNLSQILSCHVSKNILGMKISVPTGAFIDHAKKYHLDNFLTLSWICFF
jgi:hypothetical protein